MKNNFHEETIRGLATLIAQGQLDISAVSLPTRTSFNSDATGNILADTELLAWIRRLPDFDLIMLLSEIDQFGWDFTLRTIELMKDALGDLRDD